nr:MAG TPA: hypothetical protein [Caudoviricetes sp.]
MRGLVCIGKCWRYLGRIDYRSVGKRKSGVPPE